MIKKKTAETTVEEKTTVRRTAKIAIVMPTNCTWKTAGRALRSARKGCIFCANWTVTSLLAQDRKAFTCGKFSSTGELILPTKGKNRKGEPKLDIPSLETVTGEDSDYQLLRQRCPHISSNMVSSVQMDVRRQYFKHRFDSLINRGRPPTFRSFPIPIHNQRWHLEAQKNEEGYMRHYLVVSLLSRDSEGFEDLDGKPLRQIRFLLHSWKNRGFERQALDAIAAGAKRHELKIQLNEAKKKWIVLIPYDREIGESDLVDGRVMDVFPYGTASFLKCVRFTNSVPWSEDIEYGSVARYQKFYQDRRAAIGMKYRQDTKHGNGPKVGAVGHGRKRAIKNKLPMATKYNNFVKSFNQQRASHIARIAARWRCSEVHMVDLCKVDKEHLILGNWQYYDFQVLVKNACEIRGIKLVVLDNVVEELQQEFREKTAQKESAA